MLMRRGRRRGTEGAAAAKKPVRQKGKLVSFQFTAPEARAVAVAGDFNHWDPQASPLRKYKNGVWKKTLRLQPGTYQYKFVVDGREWVEDPLNPHKIANPHGTFNSICEVA